MNHDIGPAIGFILVALVAFLILFSAGGDGKIFDIAVNEMNKSFGVTTTPSAAETHSSSPGFIDWLKSLFNKKNNETLEAQNGNYPCVSYNSPEFAELLYVVDGDTISVRMADGTINRVRYIGVNTAEEGTQHYEAGKKENNKLVSRNNGILTMYKDKSNTDSYGRLLRYVFSGDTFVNYELINSGVAEALTIAPDTSCSALFEKNDHYIGRMITRDGSK